jgi:hypothetical protein
MERQIRITINDKEVCCLIRSVGNLLVIVKYKVNKRITSFFQLRTTGVNSSKSFIKNFDKATAIDLYSQKEQIV